MLFYNDGRIRPFAGTALRKHRLYPLVFLKPPDHAEDQIFALASISGLATVSQTPGGAKLLEASCDAYCMKFPHAYAYEYDN